MRYFLLYLLLINGAAFVLMLVDKYKAKRNLWRIPERDLFAAAMLGGSGGILLGMYAVRHKTRHRKFVIGIPTIGIVQISLFLWIWMRFCS